MATERPWGRGGERERPESEQVAPADAAPELTERGRERSDREDEVELDDSRLLTDGGRDEPMPGVPDTGHSDDGDGCGCGSSCGCGGHSKRARGDGQPGVVPDGGATPANVDEHGQLRDVEFTEPATGQSQDVYDTPADRRVQRPGEEDLALDTPSYEIRSRMNDIETPDEKTWFMELD
ncbi:MAG: coenzyme F420 hydrogenase, partial [Halosimplex sp.]